MTLRRMVAALAACALAPACKDDSQPAPRPVVGGELSRPDPCVGPTETTGALRWINDDLARALACAEQRRLPVVLDLWAPWCHTCLSMKHFVFPDPALAPLADRFVFAAADTDKEENAARIAAYPIGAWPTFYVLGADGKVHGRFVGAASVEQFRAFLVESEKVWLGGADLAGTPLAKVAEGDRLVVASQGLPRDDPRRAAGLAAADAAYRAALAAAPAGWPRRPEVLVSALGTIARRGDHAGCVAFVRAHLPTAGRAASATDFLAGGLRCADELELASPEPVATLRAQGLAFLEGLVDDAAAPLSTDDRSDAMIYLRDLYEDLARPIDAVAIAEKNRALLDAAFTAAPSARARMTYAYHLVQTYAYLQKHAELVPRLEALVAELPEEYEAPYRLAWLLAEAGQLDAAERHARTAAQRAYGPRKVRAQGNLVDILRKRGDTAGELAARRELVAIHEQLPPEQAMPDDLARARAELAALEQVAAPR